MGWSIFVLECSGYGVKTYGDTSTWIGGIGGQTITQGICNKCWGTGDAQRPGTSFKYLREYLREFKRVAQKVCDESAEGSDTLMRLKELINKQVPLARSREGVSVFDLQRELSIDCEKFNKTHP